MDFRIEIFNGDTIENFQTCASFTCNGRVIFDKRKQPSYEHKNAYFTSDIALAFYYALLKAKQLDHEPLICSRAVLFFSPRRFFSLLAVGSTYNVRLVWGLKADCDWRQLDDWKYYHDTISKEEVFSYLQPLDPTLLLK